jgi:hypothetical protein
MIEHLNYNSYGEREVFLIWSGSWYRIPFFVLQDLIGEVPGVGKWLIHERTYEHPVKLDLLKRLLEPAMPCMTAYKLHGQPAVIEGMIDGEYKRLELVEKFVAGTL